MAAGYFIIRSTGIRDQQAFDEYAKLWAPIAAQYGARFIAGRGVRHETLEGEDFPRVLIVEFDSYETAVACYNDPAYEEAMVYSRKAYERRDVVAVEGM